MKMALDAWQELPEGTIHTIPVRLDDCEVPESFRHYNWANFFDPNGFDRIVRAIRAELAKRPLSEPDSFTNSIGMEFVLIPAGTFMMGSPDSDAEASDREKPAHHVTISQPFYLGKYLVTQAQWKTVMGRSLLQDLFRDYPTRPVINVSWDNAIAFLGKLNEREGGDDYRLPTEAQWEYACRAGTESSWYHPDIHAIAWHYGNSALQAQPVGMAHMRLAHVLHVVQRSARRKCAFNLERRTVRPFL